MDLVRNVQAGYCCNALNNSQSLALALYFASRGIGQIRKHKEAEPVPYTSPARVLLNGLGSDELLGGYGRHRTAYTAGGWDAVVKEVHSVKTRSISRKTERSLASIGNRSNTVEKSGTRW